LTHRLAPIAAAVLATAGALPTQAADLDALNLQMDPAPAAAAAAPATRIFLEGTVGRADQRYGLGSRSIGRVALDARSSIALGASTQATLSARLDASRPEDDRIDNPVFSLREAYVGWQDDAATSVVEAGRINLREGPGYGYNPTDFFRDRSLRTISTQNPFLLREQRMGSVMLRAQRLWPQATVSVVFSPKLDGRPSDDRVDLDLGATNAAHRGLVTLGNRWSEQVNSQLTVYKEDGSPLRVGASATALVSDAAVAHAEWAYGREPDLRSRALQLPAADQGRHRLAVGLTYTTSTRLSVTAEAQYNGFALDRDGWRALVASGTAAQAAYFGQAVALQDNAAREAVLIYATQPDLGVKNLDLTALAKFNRTDRSRLTWLELRYRMDRADVALQWQRNNGVAGSEFGLPPLRDAVSVLGTVYF
jgi:hypothetical protein